MVSESSRVMFHTQEKRGVILNSPIICVRRNAWLGKAYYFWDSDVDAIHWGNSSKKSTGYFEVYSATVECSDVLDTVFNEAHYKFWLKQIEKAANHFKKKTGVNATIREINQYFIERASWSEVKGVLFQDLPKSEDLLVQKLYYRKRIQLAVYDTDIISNFALHFEMACS